MVGLNVFFLNGGNYPGALLLLEKSIRAPCYFWKNPSGRPATFGKIHQGALLLFSFCHIRAQIYFRNYLL